MKYIKGYNGLRAVSILLVLFTHLGFLDNLLANNYFFTARVLPLISGITGVNIFFSLSGFLITKILLADKSRNHKISFKNFYIRRFLRLLPPLLIFCFTLFILMELNFISASKTGLIFSLLYIYNFIPNKFYSAELGHTWSLGIEEQFYFIWPFIVNYFKKTKAIIFALLIITACFLGKLYLPVISFQYHGKLFYLNDVFKVERWFIPAVAPIMAGSIFAFLILNNESKSRVFFEHKIAVFIISILLFLSPLYMPAPALTFCYIIQSAGISLLLAWILYNQNSVFTNLLEFKPLAYLGKISYGVYVYHGLFIRTGPGGTLWIQKFPINIFLTLLTAILSYELIEKQILKYKTRFV